MSTPTPTVTNKPTVVANAKAPAAPATEKPTAEQMEVKADKPKQKRERGPNKPMLMDIKAFALALKEVTTLDALYEATKLPRSKESLDFMKSTWRVLKGKGFKVPHIIEFAPIPRNKYPEDELTAILGIDPDAVKDEEPKA